MLLSLFTFFGVIVVMVSFGWIGKHKETKTV